MRQKLFAIGLMIAVSLAGAAWALQPIPATAAQERVVALNATPQDSAVLTPTEKSGAAATTTATGLVASVDRSEGRVQLMDDETLSASGRAWSNIAVPRRLLGLWLLAITGTTVVLRARRPQTI